MTDEKKPKRNKWLDAALAKASMALSVGSEAAEVLVHFKPTPVGISAVGLRVVDSIRHLRQKSPYEYFGDEWRTIDVFGFEQQIYMALIAFASPERVPGVHEYEPCYITTVDEVEIGWLVSGGERSGCQNVENAWVRKDVPDEVVFRIFGRAMWVSIGSNRAVLGMSGSLIDNQVAVYPEPDKKVLPSKMGRDVLERAVQFHEQGHNRSVFFLGDEGTGKSCLMQFIAHETGGFSLRIRMGDLRTLDERRIAGVVKILRPDVLLIDDFDRFVSTRYTDTDSGDSYLLGALEEVNANVRLFMVSANYSEAITPAMLRPGRFDELHHVNIIDPEIVESMLEGCPRNVINGMKKMPIAYIEEFAKRVKVLGFDKANLEMRDLLKRTNRMISLNRRRGRTGRVKGSPKQRAATERRKAAGLENKAAKLIERAEKAKNRAAAHDEKAQEQAAAKAEKAVKKAKR